MATKITDNVIEMKPLSPKDSKVRKQDFRVSERKFPMSNLVERNRIIHALDVKTKEKAVAMAGAVREYVDAIKISAPLAFKHELADLIGGIKKQANLPILACFKVADIPKMSGEIMEVAMDAGADGITVHGMFGRDTIKACIDVANPRGVGVFVVTEMSHPGALEFNQPVGEKIAKMARDLGASGIVAPATRPARVKRYREIIGNNMLIISPGIGPQGANLGDAIKAGANFEIIGRLIYNSPDPAEAARKISLQLKKRLEGIRVKV